MSDKRASKPIPVPAIRRTQNHSPIPECSGEKSKTASSLNLPFQGHRDELVVDEIPRRRSQSAPLNLEASGVASRLRQASDSFQSSYEKQNLIKKRRVTVGGHDIASKRKSWPTWHPQINEEGEDPVFKFSSQDPPPGTSV